MKYTTIKKEYIPQGTPYKKDNSIGGEIEVKAVVVELYYTSGRGYYLNAYACRKTINVNGFTMESTFPYGNGRTSLQLDGGRISKTRTEQAVADFEKYKDSLVRQVLRTATDW